jgi:N utilization substance protein A
VEALADMTPEQLEAIEGIGPKTVEKISVAVNNYFATLEGGDAVALPENEGEQATQEAAGESEATEQVAVESEAGEPQSEESVQENPEAVEPAEQKE